MLNVPPLHPPNERTLAIMFKPGARRETEREKEHDGMRVCLSEESVVR